MTRAAIILPAATLHGSGCDGPSRDRHSQCQLILAHGMHVALHSACSRASHGLCRWCLDLLRRLVWALGACTTHLSLESITVREEARMISHMLTHRSRVEHLSYSGSVFERFPASLRSLDLLDLVGDSPGEDWDADRKVYAEAIIRQTHSQALLASLQGLSQLEMLSLEQQAWRVHAADVQRLAQWLPCLRELSLHLQAFDQWDLPQHVGALRMLPDVQLHLRVSTFARAGEGLTDLLRELQPPMRLATLGLTVDELDAEQEELLAHAAGGCISEELVLGVLAAPQWRLKHPPCRPQCGVQGAAGRVRAPVPSRQLGTRTEREHT